ncbi:MAG: helix-turn-helix domain-containing protein [Nitrospira sp.]|nr:helix-turn-helix domain-containing protein [Nitrospira sp.]MDH4245687.1 helix-turn-helix domain-containing protein [Nitrospira sp.]MDH4354469.1 helix-turn-helix domain-containing protein [Nitrospira sp.]MDH5319218.1 helix-turn-helix domain-containing protein [Nitrospira sp.]
MKARWLTVPELAAVLQLSVVSVRRAYWKGHLPVIRIGRMVRFDLDQVRQAIQRNGHGLLQTIDSQVGATRRAPGGASRRRDGPPSPRIVKRGRKFQPRIRRDV